MANRHDIYIWEASAADLSKDFNELLESGGDYAEIEQSPSANLLAFADALQQHQKTVDYGDGFFKQAAYVVKQATTQSIMIEIPEYEWQRPLRDIVQLALDYNLIVADEEIAMVFLPTGKIRPYGAEDEWDALLGELAEADELRLAYKKTNLPTTEYEYTLWVRPILTKRLGECGFKLAKVLDDDDWYGSWYCREVECGQQYIEFRHSGEAPYFNSGSQFYMICPAISDIYYRFDFSAKHEKIFSCSLGDFKELYNPNPDPLSEDLAQRRINDVISYIIKPIFEKTTDIKGLDNFVNGWLSKQPLSYVDTIKNPPPSIEKPRSEWTFLKPDTFKGTGVYCPQQLIVARLANNPEYEKLKSFFEAHKIFTLHGYKQDLATEWPKLVQYLDEEINPETFWQQYALLKEELKRLEEDRIQQFVTQFKLNPEQEVIPVSDQWYDAKTNLIWQRCCMGEHWQDGHKSGTAERLSWDEKNAYLERFKDTGWRLPTRVELEELVLSRRVGYITKNGFGFYEATEVRFCNWIEPHKSYSGQDICILSTSPSGASAKFRDDPNLVGFLRLVKSVS